MREKRMDYLRYAGRKPLAASGGIKARTARGHEFAVNWWSRRWINTMEESIDAGRLARGKSYARKGQVIGINIEPGMVTALVQGARKAPYQLRLCLETVNADARDIILFRFREDAALTAKLLAGELPEETAEIFAEAGTPLFPNREVLRRARCSCPDDAVPCKHVIAVLFLLGEEISCDPFLLLRLRGLEKESLIEMLTLENASDFEASSDPGAEDESGALYGGAEIPEEAAPEEISPELPQNGGEWFCCGKFAPRQTEQPAGRQAEAFDIMSDFPFWKGEQPFRRTLVPIYEQAAVYAGEILTGEKKKPVGRPRKIV